MASHELKKFVIVSKVFLKNELRIDVNNFSNFFAKNLGQNKSISFSILDNSF